MALGRFSNSQFQRLFGDLISWFGAKGVHTISLAHCPAFHDRIYNNSSNIDLAFATDLKKKCHSMIASTNVDILAPLSIVLSTKFYNSYFINLNQRKGLLESDKILFPQGNSISATVNLISQYMKSLEDFKIDFASGIIRMSKFNPFTGLSKKR
ncbi:lignin-forming anionic peroxidase-like [Ziziphus jujuba]|uniref:peroxidase n=1 Tax=Ziziphus jujuba TaxID=326968 RepID=A0ABM4A2S5_ZIZJJ|nr:lignin-forming anionic peroxidase-like [Ziziphus jujuba]